MKDLNILILNDLCSYGKASITVNIPILASFGIKISPLISVILSNHTAFDSFYASNLTLQLEEIVKELKKRKAVFDAFYIGWIASNKQPEIAIDLIKYFNIKTVLLDPILGDNGKFYSSMSNEHAAALKKIIKYSNILTPNVTELAILLDKDPSINYSEKEVINMAKEITKIGAETIIVTSVSKTEDGIEKIGCISYKNDNVHKIYYPKINISIPGTGDAFNSSLLGYILTGDTIENSLEKATKFIYSAVEQSVNDNDDRIYGIAIEKMLNLL